MSNQEIVPIIVKYNKLRSLFYFFLFLSASLLISIASAKSFNTLVLKGHIYMFIVIPSIIISIMSLKFAVEEIKKVLYIHPVLIINENGIFYKTQLYAWKTIQNIKMLLIDRKYSDYALILYFKHEKIIIKLNSLNATKEKIEKTARYFFKHDQNPTFD